MKKIIVSVFALAAVAFGVNAANTLSGDGKAVLTQALSIAKTGFTPSAGTALGTLDFGTIAIGAADTKFTVAAASGALTADVLPSAGGAKPTGGTPSAAAFLVSGTSGQTFTVSLGAPSATSAQGTTLSNLTSSYNSSLIAAGNQVSVGGDLLVPSTATSGTVAWTFSLTVNYN